MVSSVRAHHRNAMSQNDLPAHSHLFPASPLCPTSLGRARAPQRRADVPLRPECRVHPLLVAICALLTDFSVEIIFWSVGFHCLGWGCLPLFFRSNSVTIQITFHDLGQLGHDFERQRLAHARALHATRDFFVIKGGCGPAPDVWWTLNISSN